LVNKKKDNVIEPMSEQEVYDILKFAQSLGYNQAVLTPMLINQRMKDITLNPVQATENELTEAMKAPKDNEIALQEFSQDFEIQSQVYRKLLSYLGNMLSFDMTYECINIKESSEYTSPAYKKDLDAFKLFVDGFDYKKEFTSVVNELLRNEAAFYCPRTDGVKTVLQELPASPTYTMITGRWSEGLLFDFNMYWFLQPGVDLKMYPEFFVKKYISLWQDGSLQNYVPSLSPMTRGGSAWVYWQSVPVDVGWCFKFNPTSATRVPYFSGLFLDLIQQPLIRALQKNINMSVASRMIMGQVGTLKDASAKLKDQFQISPDILGKFLALVKAAVGESLKVAAAPLENLQAIAFPAESGVYNEYLKTALATSGVNTNLIFTSDVRPNAIESQLSLNVDEQMMYSLYPQFEAFMNYHLNKLTKKYKFKVHFEGTHFYNNRQQRLDNQVTLMSNGIVLPHKVAAAIGMSPFEMQRNMDEAKAMGWVDALTPIVAGFQMSGDDKEGGGEEKKPIKKAGEKGRPAKSDTKIGDAGAETRSTGANVSKGGKK